MAMLTALPPIVAQFVEAGNARDLDRFIACFASDAVVEDEGKTHNGIAEIREWNRQTHNRYTYTAEPVDLVERGGQAILTATLAGDFPGSPIDLTYEFTIADGTIAALSIHP
jgi:hypothetical protein